LFGGVRSRLTLVLFGLPILPAVVVLVYTLVAGASITPVMVVAAAAVVAALLGSRLIAQWTAPINQLIASAQAVARGEKREPLRLNRGDEFDLLAEAINQVEVRLHSTLQQASEERARLASVLAHLVSGVILTDPKGTVVLVNPAVRRLLGVTQEPIGRNHRFLHRSYELGLLLERVRRTGERIERQVTLHSPERTYVHVVALPITVDDVPRAGVLAILRDVTETRRLQQLKANLIADVSHELKTPVTAIRGFAETLLDGALDRPDAATRFVRIIEGEASRLQRLIEDLLQLSLIESRGVEFRDEPVDMCAVTEDIVHRFRGRAEEREVDLELELAASRPVVVTGDRHYLEQAVSNLVDNALKFTPKGGRVVVSLQAPTEDRVQVSVSDTGVGIPGGDIPYVFHRFFRVERARGRKEGGTGLGLAIAKHIVSAHHGSVGVESEVGEGSRFWIQLPLRTTVVTGEPFTET